MGTRSVWVTDGDAVGTCTGWNRASRRVLAKFGFCEMVEVARDAIQVIVQEC